MYNLLQTKLNDFDKRKFDDLSKNRFYRYFKVSQTLSVDPVRKVSYIGNIVVGPINFEALHIELANHRCTYKCKYCKSEGYEPCFHVIYLLNEIANGRFANVYYDKATLEKKLDELQRQFDKKMFEKKKQENDILLGTLVRDIEFFETLPPSRLAHLQPLLINVEGENKLGLKIGDDKMYVVKSVKKFLDMVKTQEVYRYGKSFELNHSYKNFDAISQQLYLLLNSAYQFAIFPEPSRYVPVLSSTIEKIIELYTNNYILIEEKATGEFVEAFVSDKEYEPILEINDTVLLFKNLKDYIYIATPINDYIVINNVLYKVKKESQVARLISFIGKCKQFDFKYNKERFLNEVYTRYHNNIATTEQFKQENPIKDLTIESYFDFEDKSVTLETKYLIGDTPVNIDSITDKPLFNKLTRYNAMISGLGFVNDRIDDDQDVGRFVKTDLKELKAISTIYLSETLRGVQVKSFQKAKTNLGYNSGMLEICFEELNFSDEELYTILSAIRKKKKYARLNKNTIVEIDEAIAGKFIKTVEEFDLDAKHLTEVQTKPLYQTLKLFNDNDEFVDYTTDDVLKEMLHNIASYKDAPYLPPANLASVMREYQVDAFKWIKTLIRYNFCGILADDMGLGKTLEIISVILSDDSKKPSLIVCPKSLSYNWRNEFKKWADEIKVVNINGSGPDRARMIKEIANDDQTVYVTSYDSLRIDLEQYKDKKFRFMILDEAQFIKNHTTLKAKSVKQIKAELRFVLTGTPIENTVVDLWSIFDFLMPNYLYNYSHFKQRFEKGITQFLDTESIELLVKKITPFILRRTKQEVLKNLPEKIETVRYATMTEEQRKVYEAQLLKTKDLLLAKDKFLILQSLTRLRQISVNPAMFINDYKGGSAKSTLAIEMICEMVENGHKVLLFSQFTTAFDDIESGLKQNNIAYFILTGKTNAMSRVDMAEAFNDPNSPEKVFLVSLKAGGTGLNLVGADVVIHLDPWWNVAAENQATDRAHRIGQERVVQVIKLVCEDSIEQKVIELQQLKQNVVDAVIANNDDNIVHLSDNDLKYLLS